MNKQRRIVAYLDGLPPFGDASQQAKIHALRELQTASGEELSVLMANFLDKGLRIKERRTANYVNGF